MTRWAGEARRVVAGIEARGQRALLVGGTGLYFQALVDGLCPPGRYPAVRDQLTPMRTPRSCTGGWRRSTPWPRPGWNRPTGGGSCERWR